MPGVMQQFVEETIKYRWTGAFGFKHKIVVEYTRWICWDEVMHINGAAKKELNVIQIG